MLDLDRAFFVHVLDKAAAELKLDADGDFVFEKMRLLFTE
jgi:hypothetical protein